MATFPKRRHFRPFAGCQQRLESCDARVSLFTGPIHGRYNLFKENERVIASIKVIKHMEE